MSDMKPTPLLRWFRRSTSKSQKMGLSLMVVEKVLQQLWADDDSAAREWRDVPTVVETPDV